MSHYQWSLDEWKEMFKAIYEARNQTMNLEQTLHRLIEEVAELVKPILTIDLDQITWHIPDVLAWTCAFTSKLGSSLDEIMRVKYVARRPGKGQTSLAPYALIGKEKPENLSEWQEYLGQLYKDENLNNPPDVMVMRLIEDVGITSRKLRMRAERAEVEDRLAGVLGWTIAIANKFKIDLVKATWEKYPEVCWKCKKKPCVCFKLKNVFISYTPDLEREAEVVKKVIEDEFKLKTSLFKGEVLITSRAKVIEIRDAVNATDAGIILVGSTFNYKSYVELIELLIEIDAENLWFFLKGEGPHELKPLIEGLKQHYQILRYKDDEDLREQLRSTLSKRLTQLLTLSAA
ncbi:MAG: hypothetical protein QXK12_05575 [Candidatus Nezhaarchaeales archaeon]